MKKYVLGFCLLSGLFAACESTPSTDPNNNSVNAGETQGNTAEIVGKKTLLTGNLKGFSTGTKLFLDRRNFETLDVLGDKAIGEDGAFSWDFGVKEVGIYRLRINEQRLFLLLEGGEQVKLQGDLNGSQFSYSIEGSPLSDELRPWVNSTEVDRAAQYIREEPATKALIKLFLLERLPLPQYMEEVKKVVADMKTQYPEADLTRGIESRVLQLEAQFNRATVALGKAVPEIRLPDPSGKEIALSSLKGKVVLIDFWASWCRPCRMENPNVVRIYNANKDKGFTVYSVSLDGLDDRQQLAMGQDPNQLKGALERQRQLWTKAIKDDGLVWSSHVSELRSWSSSVAQLYGVDAIPRTYLIDRQGVLRYMNLRGAELEAKVNELLKS